MVLSLPEVIFLPELPLESPEPKITLRVPVDRLNPVYGPIAILYAPVVLTFGSPPELYPINIL